VSSRHTRQNSALFESKQARGVAAWFGRRPRRSRAPLAAHAQLGSGAVKRAVPYSRPHPAPRAPRRHARHRRQDLAARPELSRLRAGHGRRRHDRTAAPSPSTTAAGTCSIPRPGRHQQDRRQAARARARDHRAVRPTGVLLDRVVGRPPRPRPPERTGMALPISRTSRSRTHRSRAARGLCAT
jgi:hypothetical protein